MVVDTTLGESGEDIEPERVGYAETFPVLVEREINVNVIIVHFIFNDSDVDAIYVAMAVFFKDEQIPGSDVRNEGGA